MGIERINHLYVETQSFSDALAFWEGLGFVRSAEWGERGHKAARLEAGDTYIILVEDETPELTAHFHISDIETYAKQIHENRAITVQIPLERTHWGSRWMRIQDPDGHIIALEEPPEKREGIGVVFDVRDAKPEEVATSLQGNPPVVVEWASLKPLNPSDENQLEQGELLF
jgi:uncharacterized glyoxalase superfamily protein PhnB